MHPRVLISDASPPPPCRSSRIAASRSTSSPASARTRTSSPRSIGDYDGLAIRSATKVTAKILDAAKSLKVIGRAGIGVDNVDIPAATARGIIVMNTPFGNSITTAEHAIAMMFALARQIPAADASTQAGKWEKNRFMGVEIFGKTLGIIGCGNIGSIVADRAIGLKMKVIAYDPFLSPERALDLGVEKVELDELLAPRRLHHPAHAADRQDPQHPIGRRRSPRPRRACASSIAPAAGWSTRRRCATRSTRAMSPAPPSTCSSRSRQGQPAVRRSERRVHAASRRLHDGGAGERRAAGRRADVRLSAARRDHQRPELPLDHAPRRRRSSSPSSRWPRSSAPSPASSPRPASRRSASPTRARSRR